MIKRNFPGVKIVVGGILASLVPDKINYLDAEVFKGIMSEVECLESDFELMKDIPTRAVVKFSRGCPNRCVYCAVPIIEGRKPVLREISEVISEMKHKKEKYGIKHFVFWESNIFGANKNYFPELLETIAGAGLDISISFPEGIQPNLITEQIAKNMKAARVERVVLSFESSAKEFEGDYSRPVGSTSLKDAVELLVQNNVIEYYSEKYSVFVLLGLPKQSKMEIVNSILEVWSSGLAVCFTPFTPIPGTPIYADNKEYLNNKSLLELHPMLWPFSSEEINVEWLEKVFSCNSKSSLFQIEKRSVFNIFHSSLEKYVKKIKISDIEKKVELSDFNVFSILDIKLDREDMNKKNAKLIKDFLLSLKDSGKIFYLYRPLPSKFIKFAPAWYDNQIPRNCDYCLDRECQSRHVNKDELMNNKIMDCKLYG